MRPAYSPLLVAGLVLSGCGKPTLVAFGDSVTYGLGGNPGGYVTDLSFLLEEPVVNDGLPGERAWQGKARFSGPVGPLALTPWLDTVLLLEGGNDLSDAFRSPACEMGCGPRDLDAQMTTIVGDVQTMVEASRDAGKRVVLGTYWRLNPQVCQDTIGVDADQPLDISQTLLANQIIDAFDARLAAMAAGETAPVARLDRLGLETDPANYGDCVHPSPRGYRQVAQVWADVLRRGE